MQADDLSLMAQDLLPLMLEMVKPASKDAADALRRLRSWEDISLPFLSVAPTNCSTSASDGKSSGQLL